MPKRKDPSGKHPTSVHNLVRPPDWFQFSIDPLPYPAVVFTPEGTVLRVNAATVRLFEADSADRLLDTNIYESGKPDQPWNGAAAAAADLQNGRKIQLQKWRLTTLKGNQRLLDIVAVPATSDERKVEYVLGFAREVSGQERAESEQSLLAAIVQSADAAIVSLSLDFRILSWNAAAEKLFGYAAEETIGRRAVEIITRQGCEEHALADFFSDVEAFRERAREANYFERVLRRKDATSVQVSLISSGIYDRDGQLTGVSIIVRDISEQKRTEKEQALLAAAVRSSDDAIVSLSLVSPDFPVMTWNKGAERLFGFTADEAVGRSIADLYVVPELRKRAMNSVREHVATFERHPESVSRLEVPARRRDGTLLEVSIAVSGIFDGSGNILGLSSIIRDITKRKHAEREQALLASIVASSDDAIIGLAPDGRVMSWNQGAQGLFGFQPDEALGQTAVGRKRRSVATLPRSRKSRASFAGSKQSCGKRMAAWSMSLWSPPGSSIPTAASWECRSSSGILLR
jgi:PAS domain S-box-containing protein